MKNDKKLNNFIRTILIEFLNEEVSGENFIELFDDKFVSLLNRKVEGGFLNKKQADDLQKEIESNYSETIKLGPDNNDIRQDLFNYDNPLAEKYINGVNLRITTGLIEDEPHSGKRRKTYLLYADGNIVGKFYSVDDIKKIVKYIEDNLIKNQSTLNTKYGLNEALEQIKYIYHGTGKGQAQNIQRDGFMKPKKTGEEQASISFTNKLDYAEYYAKSKGGLSKAIILRTKLTDNFQLSPRIANNKGDEYITFKKIPSSELEVMTKHDGWQLLDNWNVIFDEPLNI